MLSYNYYVCKFFFDMYKKYYGDTETELTDFD